MCGAVCTDIWLESMDVLLLLCGWVGVIWGIHAWLRTTAPLSTGPTDHSLKNIWRNSGTSHSMGHTSTCYSHIFHPPTIPLDDLTLSANQGD